MNRDLHTLRAWAQERARDPDDPDRALWQQIHREVDAYLTDPDAFAPVPVGPDLFTATDA